MYKIGYTHFEEKGKIVEEVTNKREAIRAMKRLFKQESTRSVMVANHDGQVLFYKNKTSDPANWILAKS